MILVSKVNLRVKTQVRRTPNNTRIRPNDQKRHDPMNGEDQERDKIVSLHFINDTDLEWLSLNYRKEIMVYGTNI